MTVQSKSTTRPSSVTTGPITGSRKIYSSPEGRPDILVPNGSPGVASTKYPHAR
jgi:phosphomethylpyrimidine synthase